MKTLPGWNETANGRLVVEPTSGLGNRLLAMSSGVRIAKMQERSFALHWCVDRFGWVSDNFPALFDSEIPLVDRTLATMPTTLVMEDFAEYGKMPLLPEPETARDVWVREGCSIIGADEEVDRAYSPCNYVSLGMSDSLKYFRPRKDLLAQVDAMSESWGNDVLGLHIRAPVMLDEATEEPGNTWTRGRPSISDYAFIIHRILTEFTSVKIFLSTSRPEVEDSFRELFPDKIITFTKNSYSIDLQGNRDSLVDMSLLSRCSLVIRHLSSTFSYIGALMTFRPMLCVAYDDKDPALIVGVREFPVPQMPIVSALRPLFFPGQEYYSTFSRGP